MEALPHLYLVGGTALGASGRSNNGLKLDVKTGKLSLWRLFPTFTFTFYYNSDTELEVMDFALKDYRNYKESGFRPVELR